MHDHYKQTFDFFFLLFLAVFTGKAVFPRQRSIHFQCNDLVAHERYPFRSEPLHTGHYKEHPFSPGGSMPSSSSSHWQNNFLLLLTISIETILRRTSFASKRTRLKTPPPSLAFAAFSPPTNAVLFTHQ